MENTVLDHELVINNVEAKYAAFWIRVGALLVDGLVMLPLVGINLYNLYTMKILAIQIAVLLLTLAYKPFMEFKYGATLGKMAVKIKLIDINGGPISLNQALTRYIPWIISYSLSFYTSIVLFTHPDFADATSMASVSMLQSSLVSPFLNFAGSALLIVALLFVAFNKKNQGLHDMLAKTLVVEKE